MASQVYNSIKPFFDDESVRHFLKVKDIHSLYEAYFTKYGYNNTLTNILIKELGVDPLKYYDGAILNFMFQKCDCLRGQLYFDVYPNITKIGVNSFSQCTNITEVDIGKTIKDVGINAFDGCTNLQRVYFNWRTVPNCCFVRCSSLKEVEIGGDVVSIGEYAFKDDPLLDVVNLIHAKDLHTVHSRAFKNCTNLEHINFNNTKLANIKSYAFDGCSNLRTILLPHTVLEIRQYAFTGCNCLSEIHYAGTRNDWDAIDCHPGAFDNSMIINCSDGVIAL
jgi:hypothetical protein